MGVDINKNREELTVNNEKTYYFIIEGNVQDVGFRDAITKAFIDLGIEGAVFNYKDNTVRLFVNTDNPDVISAIILKIGNKLKDAVVENIEYSSIGKRLALPTNEDIKLDVDSLIDIGRKLDKGVNAINKLVELQTLTVNKLNTIDNKLDKLNAIDNKLDALNSKFDILIDIQRKTLEILNKKL
ncbi:acylphosphatase [Methanothermococcus sp.]|uniref:acylphosphatase n=1 Tax=Methanothermococcus sp. TaxID=2614238 RepID=UPI0025ECA4BC|nr:acylphosphatase [Methanothermococcus sp.]